MRLTDILFILFRHKWKIIICAVTGIIAAGIMLVTKTPQYISEARIFIRFVQERTAVTPLAQGERISRGDQRSETIVMTETEILTSQDVAESVARAVGPARILAPFGGGTDSDVSLAGSVIRGRILIFAPGRTSVLHLQFKHPDPTVVQPVLTELIATYLKKHTEIHRSVGKFDEFLNAETDTRHARLVQTEEELRRLLDQAGVHSIEEARDTYSSQMNAIRRDVMSSEAELAERRAAVAAYLGESAPTEAQASEAAPAEPPPETVGVYQAVIARLSTLRQREQELLLQFTPETPMVKGVRAQIQESEETRSRLEKDYPSLAGRRNAVMVTSGAGDRSSTFDPAAERARIRALESRLTVLRAQLERLREETAALGKFETSIAELKRQKEIVEQQYKAFAQNREQMRIDQALSANEVSNISTVQEPSPPLRDLGALYKIVGGLGFGGLALGLGLAFAFEFYVDQSVRRPSEIETTFKLPLIMSIPRVNGKSLTAEPSNRIALPGADKDPTASLVAAQETAALGPIRAYVDALRDRLVHNFEMRGITRKPKLVAVTGCNPASGVSTIASGLAASLSETGDGNVLLVDMNPARLAPQHFQKGQLQVGLNDVLEQEKRDDALVRENLYRVSQANDEDRLSWIIPKRFASLVPKMKASDFDYIIFDMPPVSQVSATPQLSRFMDSVLLVVESEKTSRDAARKAATSLQEAGANVAVVMNKSHNYLPKALGEAV